MPTVKKSVLIYNNIEEAVMLYSLMLMVVIVFIQVIMRYVFNNSLSWSEELVRYLFIWQVWFSSSVGVKTNDQIRIAILPDMLKSHKAKELLELFCNILLVTLYAVVLVYSIRHTRNAYLKGMMSTAMQIPMFLVYVSLPLSSVVILIRLICRIIHDISHFGYTANIVDVSPGKDAAVEGVNT